MPTLTVRQETVLRFVVTSSNAVKPNQVVIDNPLVKESPLPRTLISAQKTLHDLHKMGLVRKVGRTQIAYEATSSATEFV